MVTTFYPPYNFGGDGIFIRRLANALVSNGHQVHVIHDADAFRASGGTTPAVRLNDPGVTVHTIERKGQAFAELLLSHQLGRPLGAHHRIRTILEENDFDVIHFHNISLIGGPCVLEYGHGIKLCTMHDHWFVCATHVLWRYGREACTQRTCLRCTIRAGRPPQLWRYTGAVRRAVRHVDAFIACSEFSREAHIRNGFPAPIEHIPPFLPRMDFRASGSPAPAPHPRPYFLFAGRLVKLKGVQVLLEAFRRYDRADLVIAGEGPYESELRSQAEGLTNVKFLGKLDHADLSRFYENAIAVLVPSLCYETFGFVIIEAFAMHTPVIANNLGPLPETVKTSGGGFVYKTIGEMVQAMEALRTNPDLRAQMGRRGHQAYLDRYTEEPHLKAYFALIDKIASRKRAAAAL